MKLVLCSDKENYIFEEMDGYVLMTYWHDDRDDLEREELSMAWAIAQISDVLEDKTADWAIGLHSNSTPAQWGA